MKVMFYGTRGSVPVSGPNKSNYGGNTTCVHVESACLPAGNALVIDGGSGFVPLSYRLLREGCAKISVLLTHYHHDHTQGILLSPAVFSPLVRFDLYGPIENGVGPKQMMHTIMEPPYHPVSFKHVSNRFSCFDLKNPESVALVAHPEGGIRKIGVDVLDGVEGRRPSQIKLAGGYYNINDCLVVRMVKTNHHEQTISYRFEERPTGKVFVFLTDHENTDHVPTPLKPHLAHADLLIMDAQYSRATYDSQTAGYGHGTPDHAAQVAKCVDAQMVGLTHHDPMSTDETIDAIVAEGIAYAKKIGYKGKVFGCRDYDEIEV